MRTIAIVVPALLGRAASAVAQPLRLYVINRGGDMLSVIDSEHLALTRALPADRDPHIAVATPNSKWLYLRWRGPTGCGAWASAVIASWRRSRLGSG